MADPIFRFAPSPNGYLHLGHALSALLNRRHGARGRRAAPAAHRGHRRDALPAGVRGGDLRGPRLARHRLGGAGAAAVASISPTTAPRSRKLEALGPRLSELREPGGDRAAAWRNARRAAPWPRDPDGAPLYPGAAAAPRRRTSARGASRPASPMRCGSTWTRRVARPAPLDLERDRSARAASDRSTAAAARLGRRRAGAQGDADQLSPLGRGRRRAAGRDPRGARAGSVLGDRACTGCCRRCSACRRRPITITG